MNLHDRTQWSDLNNLPHSEARACARTGAPAVLLVNPVEYHGPHLSLHNDFWVSLGLAEDLRRALSAEAPMPWLYGGELEMGVEPTSGPGSRHVPFATVRGSVIEACARLLELGVRRVILLTFHGQPLHNMALWAGVKFLREAGVPACAPMNDLFAAIMQENSDQLAPAYAMLPDAGLRAKLLAGARNDLHAGYLETSLSLHYAPHTVGDYRNVPDCPPVQPMQAVTAAAKVARLAGKSQLASELDVVAFGMGWAALRPHPGYTGCPRHASGEAGRVFAKLAVEQVVPNIHAVLYGQAEPTPPVLPWTEWATLGGRIAAVKVPLAQVKAYS